MDIHSLINMIDSDEDKKYHSDIIYLKNKLIELLEKEDYETISRIHKWLIDLMYLHHGIKL